MMKTIPVSEPLSIKEIIQKHRVDGKITDLQIAFSDDQSKLAVVVNLDNNGIQLTVPVIYVFRKEEDKYIFQNRIAEKCIFGNVDYGRSIAMSGDGNYIAVGSPIITSVTHEIGRSRVSIYHHDGDRWRIGVMLGPNLLPQPYETVNFGKRPHKIINFGTIVKFEKTTHDEDTNKYLLVEYLIKDDYGFDSKIGKFVSVDGTIKVETFGYDLLEDSFCIS